MHKGHLGSRRELRLKASPICLSRELGASSKVPSLIRVNPQHAWTLETSYPIVGCKPKIFHSSLLIQVWLLGEKHPEESLGLWLRGKKNTFWSLPGPTCPKCPGETPPSLPTTCTSLKPESAACSNSDIALRCSGSPKEAGPCSRHLA